MAPGQRQLFIYWRVAAADLPAALRALRDWQATLKARQPALQCRRYQRSDGDADEATVMETYALASGAGDGIDDGLRRLIERDGDAVLQRWLRGARHVEAFDACDD